MEKPPLVVDMDGTLLKIDTLVEMTVVYLRQNPFGLPNLIYWAILGKSVLKSELASRASLNWQSIPTRPVVVEQIRQAKEANQRVLLATAADNTVAQEVAQAVGGFDDVIASRRDKNLRGATKADELVKRFGQSGFDYIGDSTADIPVWRAARRAIVAKSSRRLTSRLDTSDIEYQLLEKGPSTAFTALLRGLRPHQWVKNVLLFVPGILAAVALSGTVVQSLASGFLMFGAAASGVYLLNDVLDCQEDRGHTQKRNRPIASGDLSSLTALLSGGLIAGAALVGAWLVGRDFFLVLLSYLVLTSLYSITLKKIVLLDVFVLALLYGIRLLAGAVLLNIPLSLWFVTFSFFAFFSLALAKRFIDLAKADGVDAVNRTLAGRGYWAGDQVVVGTLGVASAMTSAIVLALYFDQPFEPGTLENRTLLWAVVPVWLYWISRLWLEVARGKVESDPVVFALRDKTSWAIGSLLVVVYALAR